MLSYSWNSYNVMCLGKKFANTWLCEMYSPVLSYHGNNDHKIDHSLVSELSYTVT